MAACEFYSGSGGGSHGGPSTSPFAGLEPKKERALRQLLHELREELDRIQLDEGSPLGEAPDWGVPLLEQAPETPGLRELSGERTQRETRRDNTRQRETIG